VRRDETDGPGGRESGSSGARGNPPTNVAKKQSIEAAAGKRLVPGSPNNVLPGRELNHATGPNHSAY